jgi:hypothetical protein
MAVNFEQDGNARGDTNVSFRRYPATFMESCTQPGIETSVSRMNSENTKIISVNMNLEWKYI